MGDATDFCAEDRYFLQTLVADTEHFVQRAYYKTHCARNELSAVLGTGSAGSRNLDLSVYCGPKQIDELQKVDARLEPVLDYGWLGPIAKIAVQILRFLYSYVHNYGIAIILLTLLMKLLLVPFTFRMEKSAQQLKLRKN